MAGIPKLDKTVDAWDAGGPKSSLLYAGDKSPLKALPVAYVRLTVGNQQHINPVTAADTKIVFDVVLKTRDYAVRAELLDADKAPIAGAYYVYCRRL